MDKPSHLSSFARTGAIVAISLFSVYGSLAAMANGLPDGTDPQHKAALDRGEAVPIQRHDGSTVWAIKQNGEVRYFHAPTGAQSEG